MLANTAYATTQPTRTDIDRQTGLTVLNFGTNWCGHCQAAQPLIAEALADYPDVRHLKVEDGKGRPLGRSFRVTRWPTLVLLKDGTEVSRLIRPDSVASITNALNTLNA